MVEASSIGSGGGEELISVSLTVNGVSVTAAVEGRTSLADLLRKELGLTGTHVGCEQGSCGACTVIVEDDQAIRSCLMLAVQADGMAVETVEGLATTGELNDLQLAFREHHALQCGYCTSGFLMSITARLRQGAIFTEEEARDAISGNVCRCTGYVGIVEAVRSLARASEDSLS